jgi:hypothetical protein
MDVFRDRTSSLYFRLTNNIKMPPDTVIDSYTSRTEHLAPTELYEAAAYLDNCCTDSDLRGWLPAGISLWNYIGYEEHKNNIKPGMKVLEPGSGSGSSALIWSYKGYSVVGIEYLDELFEKSSENILKFKHLMKEPVKFIHGSYYPKENIEDRNSGRCNEVLIIENNELNRCVKGFKIEDHFHPECSIDVYKENGIKISDFDIIYAYMWHYQFPSVYDIFKKYARDDAVMMAIGPRYREIAKDMHMKTQWRSHIIRK